MTTDDFIGKYWGKPGGAERAINIQAISTSEIKVSVLIDEDETELAVRVLHTAYGLDAVDAAA